MSNFGYFILHVALKIFSYTDSKETFQNCPFVDIPLYPIQTVSLLSPDSIDSKGYC